ncbi:hypothetical protein [Rhizorhapis sp. SPR117]|nr:hypothetical protein [Rhizorhapis sp. SPR117]
MLQRAIIGLGGGMIIKTTYPVLPHLATFGDPASSAYSLRNSKETAAKGQ